MHTLELLSETLKAYSSEDDFSPPPEHLCTMPIPTCLDIRITLVKPGKVASSIIVKLRLDHIRLVAEELFDMMVLRYFLAYNPLFTISHHTRFCKYVGVSLSPP